jgi:molecular chaperone HscA
MNNQIDEILQLLRGIDSRLSKVEQRVADLTRHEVAGSPPVQIKSRSLEIKVAEDDEVLLCLDFGTARSKAFATRGADDVLVDVAVGSSAGSREPHSVLSCVFIGDDRRIYFGEMAAAKSELAVDKGARKRIDSFKGMITNATAGSDLRSISLDAELNPTDVKLSEGDILSLYLAYLTDMAVSDIVTRHHSSRYVKRRFTTPVFVNEHKKWADATLRRHYAEAVLLADHFTGQWQRGLDIEAAKGALVAAAKLHEQVGYLFVDSEAEPIAAFGSRFRNYEATGHLRRIVSIIDAGAGTTDFATFAIVEKPGNAVAMYLIPGSVYAVRKAGNEADRILSEYILDKHPGYDSATLGRIRADLFLQQRSLKEQLFRERMVEYTLVDDSRGVVDLADFLASPRVELFAQELRAGFETSLAGIHPSWLKEGAQGNLVVIITGGSCELPMIRSLASSQFTRLPMALKCQATPTLPKWLDDYNELKPQFPQLAVAIGGASRDLPRLAPEMYAEFAGLSGGDTWHIEPVLKGV